MKKIEVGTVVENPITLDDSCLFLLKQNDGVYLVISTDRQAAKDNIFVHRGQEMCIEGTVLLDPNIKGVLITEQAKINSL